MFNPAMYLLAYGRIYSNQGAMTPGACGETADGMSEAMIAEIIELMRFERYRFAPARRVYIPKKNGTLRPLGIPSWRDKLTGEVVRLILEAVYEQVENRQQRVEALRPPRPFRQDRRGKPDFLRAHVASVAHLGATDLDRPDPGLDRAMRPVA